MGYLFLVLALASGLTKGFCGKKVSGFVKESRDAMLANFLRMTICIAIGFFVVVFSDGAQIMDGTCAEVFSRYDELYAVGLDVPEITKVAAALKEVGVDIGRDVYTVNWAVERMMDILRTEVTTHES